MTTVHLSSLRGRTLPVRFHSLDALRGVAALAVVLWHWQHFFHNGLEPGAVPPESLPFWTWLRPFYLGGGGAVELFFCLSGFIFFHLYSERIARREVSAREFLWLRLSRLYPLHFVTLVLTALGQFAMVSISGSPLVYAENDAWHFVLQLFFVSSWGLERGFSFNGPSWSISVEMLLYGLFFLACFVGARRWWHLLALAATGYLLLWIGPIHVGRGVLSFFIGGLACGAFHFFWRRNISAWAVTAIALVTASLWLGLLVDFPAAPLQNLANEVHRNAGPAARYFAIALLQFGLLSNQLLLFPLTLVALALVEARRGHLFTSCSFLGDLSYSTYLLHFPLQLGTILLCQRFAIDRRVFLSPLALILFFGALLAVSWCSYSFLERPAQSWLRRRFLRARKDGRNSSVISSPQIGP